MSSMESTKLATSPPSVPHHAPPPDGEGQDGVPFDIIDEAIEESMLASDPPAWTPTTSIGPPDHGTDAERGQD